MFSNRLKVLRTRLGLSQSQLAREVGVSAGNIGDWESERSKPGYTAIGLLATYFTVSADYLLDLPQPTPCDTLDLTDMETDLISMMRLLSKTHQEDIFEFAYIRYKREIEEKKTSIYSTYFNKNVENGELEQLEIFSQDIANFF